MSVLKLEPPPLVPTSEAFGQLEYIERYVDDLKCKSIAIEAHYIDRDYMEDHSVFYSKSLRPIRNHCRRIHFFRKQAGILEEMRRIRALGKAGETDAFLKAARDFSAESYLGFTVIKPLPGCPVGRTVLASYPPGSPLGHTRAFNSLREYRAHFLGVELSVRGLAFQQQDLGVSACATTALWSSLSKMRDLEELRSATPAQITTLATEYNLPFGQPMPSEGLSIGQMCQAIQAVGLAPNLIPIKDSVNARGYLYSILQSGLAPVLVIESDRDRHALTATGMRLRGKHIPTLIAPDTDDLAGNMLGLYAHDDRVGPYVRIDFRSTRTRPRLLLTTKHQGATQTELWHLTHILTPVHPKVRLSFVSLRKLAIKVVDRVTAVRAALQSMVPSPLLSRKTISFETTILRSPAYIERCLSSDGSLSRRASATLCEKTVLPRYVAIIHIKAPYLGSIDLLLDTTSTRRNVVFLAAVAHDPKTLFTDDVVRYLGRLYRCRTIQ